MAKKKKVNKNPKKVRQKMFEGTTTITFSKEAAMLMLSKNISALFKMTLEVTALDFDYKGLQITFAEPQKPIPEEPEEEVEV